MDKKLPHCNPGNHEIGPDDYFYTINPEGGYGESEYLCCEKCIQKPENSHMKQRLVDNGVDVVETELR